MNKILMTMLLAVLLAACGGKETGQDAGKAPEKKVVSKTEAVISLLYQQQEPGVDPYLTRVLISPDFIRYDDNADNSDFVLFDRKAGIIYSVSHEAQTVLVIKKRSITEKSPLPLKPLKNLTVVEKAPAISGTKALQQELYVNGKVCRRQFVVPNLLPQASRAMAEFRTVLAGSLAENIKKTPAKLQDPCFLQFEIFDPNASLKDGFPIQTWRNDGARKLLVDYNEQLPVLRSLFKLPDGYRRYSVSTTGMKDQ